jgi:4-diphosphocytidyl-2-C-methyl-D-erythritol kinase
VVTARKRRLCPAKVNLYLKVLRRREDGYHELVSVMQPLTLADILLAEPASHLTLECTTSEIPLGQSNLIWRAVEKFAAATGLSVSVKFHLKKRIPVAAGLGGGSSNAAATLQLLNQGTGNPLDAARLKTLAAELGADVPFFLSPAPAVARGIGTDLSPLDLPPYWYVLLNPGIPVSTKWVYDNLDHEALASQNVPLLESWDGARPGDWVANDLESVTYSRFPVLGELRLLLLEAGALAAGMSGSGPTLFGLFFRQDTALKAARKIRRHFPGWLAIARGLTQGEGEGDWENEAWII